MTTVQRQPTVQMTQYSSERITSLQNTCLFFSDRKRAPQAEIFWDPILTKNWYSLTNRGDLEHHSIFSSDPNPESPCSGLQNVYSALAQLRPVGQMLRVLTHTQTQAALDRLFPYGYHINKKYVK